MATYALFLGAPEGEAILRKKDRLEQPDDTLGIEDSDVLALGVSPDPYVSHQVWSGPALGALRADLEARLSSWRQEVTAKILAETRRSRLEPWMEELAARRIAEDRRIGLAEKLADLVCRAESARGTIVFFGD